MHICESKVSTATGSPIPLPSLAQMQQNEVLSELPGLKVPVDHSECAHIGLVTNWEAGKCLSGGLYGQIPPRTMRYNACLGTDSLLDLMQFWAKGDPHTG